MKVLLINGSPHEKGCTYTALNEVAGVLNEQGIDTELFWITNGAVHGCTSCRGCAGTGRCVFTDDCANTIIEKAHEADGFIFGSPVHYAAPAGVFTALLDRCFFAGSAAFRFKPGAAVVSCRRAGSTAALDRLNKYFTINNMPVISSGYWNMVHGAVPEEVMQDGEGLQVMRTLGRNMAWVLKGIKGEDLPESEKKIWTNFIR